MESERSATPVFYTPDFYKDREKMAEIFSGPPPWTDEQVDTATAGDGHLMTVNGVEFRISERMPNLGVAVDGELKIDHDKMAEFWVGSIRQHIATEIRARKTAVQNEAQLQVAIAAALKKAGIGFKREHQLSPRDRLDFLLHGGVAIEVKKGTASQPELRQISRYLEHEAISAVILIAMKCKGIPDRFNDKPIRTIQLWKFVL